MTTKMVKPSILLASIWVLIISVDMRIFHVYLHSLDYEADLAVFRILPTEKHQPQHFVREDQLANTAAMSRHALHNSLFSVYYAGNDVPMNQYSAPDPLMQAKALNTDCKKKVCEFLARDSAEQQRLSDQDTMEIPVSIAISKPFEELTEAGRTLKTSFCLIGERLPWVDLSVQTLS